MSPVKRFGKASRRACTQDQRGEGKKIPMKDYQRQREGGNVSVMNPKSKYSTYPINTKVRMFLLLGSAMLKVSHKAPCDAHYDTFKIL